MENNRRWGDQALEKFHQEFIEHVAEFRTHIDNESFEQQQQQELHNAVFRKEDTEANIPPGLLQLTSRISMQLHSIQIWQDRQKTFVGGMIFAVSSFWFFLSDAGPKMLTWWHK